MSSMIVQLRRAAALEVVASVPAQRTLAVLVFTVLTALSAHVSVPVFGTPVPVSMQTLVVVLAGMLLGPRLGAASQVAYLMAGIAGLPVFANGLGLPYLFGPTGGFLLAFPAAAALAGFVASRAGRDGIRRHATLAAAALVGSVTILAGGWSQLAMMTGDAAVALSFGVLPFLAGDAAKVVVAAVLAHRLRGRTAPLR